MAAKQKALPVYLSGPLRLIFQPIHPANNNLYISIGRRRVLSPAARQWKELASRYAMLAMCGQRATNQHVRVEVDLLLTHDRDIDSVKALLDSMTGVVWADDSQVQDIHIRKRRVTRADGPARSIVTVYPLEATE